MEDIERLDSLSRPSQYRFAQEDRPWVYGLVLASMLGVVLLELWTPLGITVWIGYVIPVALALWTWRPQTPIVVAAVATVLMFLMFFNDRGSLTSLEVARINRTLGVVTIWIMAGVGWHFIRYKQAIRLQDWFRVGQAKLGETMRGDLRKEQLGENVLRFLAEYLGAHAGAFYATDGGDFRRLATYGLANAEQAPATFRAGEGLLGQAVKDRRPFLVEEVPEGRLILGSAFLHGPPRSVAIAPAVVDGAVNAVVELGFLQAMPPFAVEFLERISESLGVSVRSARYRSHLQNLLEETQRQTEELQTQGEELRVSNEELAEQSRALKEYQARLENQQAELEQTNSTLEEQTQLLEIQRDDLTRAKAEVQLRARELEQASQYKSDFLANMSHELRTPLNSSLILAKLLADNPEGNLSPEQVKYAQTIQSAGNDLLTLINDILDLSKIEAGRMDVRAETFTTDELIRSLTRGFEPLALDKGLAFRAETAPDAPSVLETDRQRLEQILKNLLANAIKFTERGHVTLKISKGPRGRIAFDVADTGIGIAQQQQDVIFEAFRQADGTTNRKYGGTGLGLSISRELARLLGGELRLVSELGRGSTFTVLLPVAYDPALVAPRPEGPAQGGPRRRRGPTSTSPRRGRRRRRPRSSAGPGRKDDGTTSMRRASRTTAAAWTGSRASSSSSRTTRRSPRSSTTWPTS